jgi:hypothetical protein
MAEPVFDAILDGLHRGDYEEGHPLLHRFDESLRLHTWVDATEREVRIGALDHTFVKVPSFCGITSR